MTARLRELSGGRLVLALEGGYNLEAMARSAAACLSVLLGDTPPLLPETPVHPAARHVLDAVRRTQKRFWPTL
jgi:histone deacetylase 6